MPSIAKEYMFNEVKKGFDENPYAFFASFEALNVADMLELRGSLEKTSKRTMMVKHTFAKKILAEKKYSEAEKFLTRSVLVTFADKDPQAVSKALVDFAKKNDKIVAEGMIFENKVYDKAFVNSLASLPSREELLTQLVVRVQSPISGLASTLNQLVRGVVVALNQIREQKAAQAT